MSAFKIASCVLIGVALVYVVGKTVIGVLSDGVDRNTMTRESDGLTLMTRLGLESGALSKCHQEHKSRIDRAEEDLLTREAIEELKKKGVSACSIRNVSNAMKITQTAAEMRYVPYRMTIVYDMLTRQPESNIGCADYVEAFYHICPNQVITRL